MASPTSAPQVQLKHNQRKSDAIKRLLGGESAGDAFSLAGLAQEAEAQGLELGGGGGNSSGPFTGGFTGGAALGKQGHSYTRELRDILARAGGDDSGLGG